MKQMSTATVRRAFLGLVPIIMVMLGVWGGVYVGSKSGGRGQEHPSDPRGIRGRVRLAGRLRPAQEGRLPCVDRPESDGDIGGRRRGDQAHAGHTGRSGDSRRAFVRRRRDHRSRHGSEGRRSRLHRGLCAGQGRVGVVPDQEPAAWRAVPPILPPQDGYLFLDRAQFRASFAADVSPEAASFMADSQVPWGLEALNDAVTEPAWKAKPSWYLVSTEDRMIPPDAQRAMSKRAGSTVAEVKGSHAVYVSQPKAVAALIAKAAHGVALATR